MDTVCGTQDGGAAFGRCRGGLGRWIFGAVRWRCGGGAAGAGDDGGAWEERAAWERTEARVGGSPRRGAGGALTEAGRCDGAAVGGAASAGDDGGA